MPTPKYFSNAHDQFEVEIGHSSMNINQGKTSWCKAGDTLVINTKNPEILIRNKNGKEMPFSHVKKKWILLKRIGRFCYRYRFLVALNDEKWNLEVVLQIRHGRSAPSDSEYAAFFIFDAAGQGHPLSHASGSGGGWAR